MLGRNETSGSYLLIGTISETLLTKETRDFLVLDGPCRCFADTSLQQLRNVRL